MLIAWRFVRYISAMKLNGVCAIALAISAVFAGLGGTSANEKIFRAGGLFTAEEGFVGLPAQQWNPPSGEAFPSSLPFRVPAEQTLLLTDLYMETDPLPPAAFLLAVYIESPDGDLTLAQTIQLRSPVDRHVAMQTPIPIRAGFTLHVQFSSLMGAPQAVAWNVGGRLVAPVPVVENSGSPYSTPAKAKPYPLPLLHRFGTSEAYATVIAGEGTQGARVVGDFKADFIADPDTHEMAKVKKQEGSVHLLDRDFNVLPGDHIIPLLAAKSGSAGNIILNEKLPDCEQISEIMLGGSFVGVFDIDDCMPGQITIEADFSIEPGQRFQVR